MADLPKISVVTICRNNAEGFLATARSVLNQDYPNLEWIVIDGLSTDGTSDYVRKLAPRMSKYKIEKDSGIYNAMNKGIEMVTGAWVFFMNADDVFFETDTVTKYVKNLTPSDDIVYSDVISRDNGKVNLYRPDRMHQFGMIFDHQTTCARTEIYKKLKYDESYRIAGDFDFFSRAWTLNFRFRKLSRIVGARKTFLSGASSGFADRQIERCRVIKKYFNDCPWGQMLAKEFLAAYKTNLIKESEYLALMEMIKE
jgi:glycosyltransferase involved in cell wall biosynthesis